MTNFIVENNFSIPVADKYGPLFTNRSPDSQIAKQYQCAKTKTVCMLNKALAPNCHVDLVSKMKTNQYTLATDGSNDSDITKMNTLTLKIVDISLFYRRSKPGFMVIMTTATREVL